MVLVCRSVYLYTVLDFYVVKVSKYGNDYVVFLSKLATAFR